MCGINGLIGFSDAKRLVRLMNDTIRHRGPDAQGEWFENGMALGHRRLSIIDLSAEANQPFIKDNLVMVYNGEVYNFLDLREDLVKKGVTFRTRSDTEVILELFRVYREKSFNKLRGMFSFCIYDINKNELFLVRDYFGIKPLYYAQIGNNQLAFSSELKALMLLPGLGKEINPKALISSINYLWISGSDSIFKNIKKLPPAHYLYLKLANGAFDIKIHRYWDLDVKSLNLSESQLKERLSQVLEESIKRHLISDVPVGSFLSGGLDSSLIAVIAKRFNNDLSTYTISVGRKEKKIERMPDDNFYAKRVASSFNIKHQDILVTPDALSVLKEMVYTLDEPIADPAAINTYLICKLAKENGIKVLLSGMGADEIFGGYRRHYATLLSQRLNLMPQYLTKSLKYSLNSLPVKIGNYGIKPIRWAKRLFSFTDMPLGLAYMRSYSYYDKEELSRLLSYDFNNAIDEIYAEHEAIFYKIKEFDNINKMCYTDINMFLTGLNLTYTDRASMAESVEVRVPFIDREVVEFAMAISGEYKIRGNISKYILKKVADDYLPKEIVYRPKASFGMPIRAWISGELKGVVDDLLSFENIRRRGWLDPEFVRTIIDRDRRGFEDNAYQIYQFLTLELWCRRFLER